MEVAGLFAGIGGFELALAAHGFHARLLCEFDPAASEVLRTRFRSSELASDIRELRSLPKNIALLTAGFPCQDLSQAGQTRGIVGERSGLVGEVFRLLRKNDVPEVLIENVPFMLQLDRGHAMRVLTENLAALGYRWAYRVLDALAFGVPQRRQRVFLFASKIRDPRSVLFRSDGPELVPRTASGQACGFYWTEGERGLGWAVDAVPTLKGGSTVGVPSPPAIWMPSGAIVTPDIRDVERLQGFPPDWTKPTESVTRAGFRWKQVGNAVAVPVVAWIAEGIAEGSHSTDAGVCRACEEIDPMRRWPNAGALIDERPLRVAASTWPIAAPRSGLAEFLEFPSRPLSARATLGFLNRLHKGSLRLAEGFLEAIERHALISGADVPARPPHRVEAPSGRPKRAIATRATSTGAAARAETRPQPRRTSAPSLFDPCPTNST